MIVAAIDIGTNSVLLLVASVSESGEITTLAHETRLPRLGRGVDAERHLQPESISRVVAVVSEYAKMIRQFKVDKTVVGGTSAVRDAANADDLTHQIQEATGYQLEVLSGSDEAILTYRGAISGIGAFSNVAVIDIGGGSTEITVGIPSGISDHVSLNVGSVRLTERFLEHDPPLADEIASARAFTREQLKKAQGFIRPDLRWVGVAGTATTIAVLVRGKTEFALADVTNVLLLREDVDRVFRKLVGMPAQEIRALSNVLEGRADVITAGTLILQEAMESFHCSDMTVSERGLRYGLALREWGRRR
jgi:exopolyphosphatase / guanosine-5'-triphosphate,3'-diphosphate pyrophosphatase